MKKKRIIIITFVLCSLIVIWQVFGIYTHRGNLSFTICNEYNIDADSIEIYIDGNRVVTKQHLDYYTFYSMYITPKNHEAVIKVNGNVSQEIKFNTILFTRIFICYYEDSVYNENGIRFNISVSKCPIQFLS